MKNFQNPQEFVVFLKEILSSRYRPPAGAVLSSAISKVKKEPLLVTAKLVFYDEPKVARRFLDYGSLLLAEEWIKGSAVVEYLESILAGKGNVSGQNISTSFEHTSGRREVGRTPNYSGWPEWVFESRMEIASGHRPQTSYEIFASPGLPPYDSEAAAIMDWMWDHSDIWTGGEPPFLGELIIIVPDTRGRIVDVDWSAEQLKGTIELNVPVEKIELQVRFMGAIENPVQLMKAPQLKFEVEISEGTKFVELYLVHTSGDVLSMVRINGPGASISVLPGSVSIEDEARRDVQGGESHEVEFKPFIVKGHAKEREVVETIIAFANSLGGRLYIGVRDDGTMEGRSGLRKTARADDEEGIEKVKKNLHKLIQDKIKPVPEVEIKFLELFGEPAFAIRVQSGDMKPYSTQDNDIFVRKGSSNLRPDAQTELPQLLHLTQDN